MGTRNGPDDPHVGRCLTWAGKPSSTGRPRFSMPLLDIKFITENSLDWHKPCGNRRTGRIALEKEKLTGESVRWEKEKLTHLFCLCLCWASLDFTGFLAQREDMAALLFFTLVKKRAANDYSTAEGTLRTQASQSTHLLWAEDNRNIYCMRVSFFEGALFLFLSFSKGNHKDNRNFGVP